MSIGNENTGWGQDPRSDFVHRFKWSSFEFLSVRSHHRQRWRPTSDEHSWLRWNYSSLSTMPVTPCSLKTLWQFRNAWKPFSFPDLFTWPNHLTLFLRMMFSSDDWTDSSRFLCFEMQSAMLLLGMVRIHLMQNELCPAFFCHIQWLYFGSEDTGSIAWACRRLRAPMPSSSCGKSLARRLFLFRQTECANAFVLWEMIGHMGTAHVRRRRESVQRERSARRR